MGPRTHIFIDGQNFYLSAKRAFGLRYPDFDIPALGRHLAARVSPDPDPVVRFYIGMPLMRFSPHWTTFWANKLEAARAAGVEQDPPQPPSFREGSRRLPSYPDVAFS